VIGDYCTDIFKYGHCNRLSPEAPVPVFLFDHEVKTEGMAGNVLNNLKALKIQVDIKVSSKESIKERYVDLKSKHHLLRADYEKPSPELQVGFKIDKYDAVVIADYNKGTITKNVFEKIVEKYDGPIFIDSKKQDLRIYNHKNCILKINQSEFEKANTPSLPNLIVTLGADGAMKDGIIYPTKKVEVFDVSGAGDSFMAGLTVQYLLTKNFEDAIKFANSCAANVVKKSGTAILNFEEVKDDLCF
jgi:D-beta-D-heptose 7-phosphate kinase/D-beta-D-heptose 1-phosphate adenosyltransferase